MAFKAAEAVEALDYDFNPYVDRKGTIPEPTTQQIERFRDAVFGVFRDSGINPESITTGKVSLELMGDLMEKAKHVEDAVVSAVADLTGIADHDINALPYRLKAAFTGWIMGQFFHPEA